MLEKVSEHNLKKASLMQSFYPMYYATYMNTDSKITANVILLLEKDLLESERPKMVKVTVELIDDPDTTGIV